MVATFRSAVALASLALAVSAAAAPTEHVEIRPGRESAVSNVANPSGARDGNAGTFAAIALERVGNSAGTTPLTATAIFDRFPSGYRAIRLEVAWRASAAFSALAGSEGEVTAALDYDLGRGWKTLESHRWTSTSMPCPTVSDQGVGCWDHLATLPLDRSQRLSLVRVRITVTAALARCKGCTLFPSANLNAQAKVFEVRIVADEATAAPRHRPATRP